MAIWYTDIAINQQLNLNYPGQTGVGTMTTQPGTQNISLFEGPDAVTATYTFTGNEVANDIINIAIAPAGTMISANGHVSTALKGLSNTLTMSIGDNDLAIASLLPLTNPQLVSVNSVSAQSVTAPEWVSATTYAAGNVVTDTNSTPASLTYTAVAATSGTTAPHSAANTVWMPNNQRYANAISVTAASANVAFAGGTQLYGGAASLLPTSVVPNSIPSNMTAAQLANNPYVIQNDCWIQALIATVNTTNLNANAVAVFRIGMQAAN